MRYKLLSTTLMLGLSSIPVIAYPPDIHRPTTLLLTSPLPASSLPPMSLQNIDEVDWEDGDDHCSTPQFKFTPENIEDSKVHQWYVESREQWKQAHAEDFKRLGEVGYFGEKVLKLQNFRCGVEKNGCDEAPTCESILKKTQQFFTDENGKLTVPRKDVISRARQKYFVVKEWQNIGRYFHILDGDLEKAQIGLQGRIPLIIRRFTSQVDKKDEIERKINKSIWDMAWALVEAGITTMYSIKADKDNWNIPNVSAFINWSFDAVKTATEVGVEVAGTLQYDKILKAGQLTSSSTPAGRARMVQSYSFDLFGKYQISENEANMANMEDHASIALRSARGALKAHAKHLFNGFLDVITEKRIPALSFLMTAEAQRALMDSEEKTDREQNLGESFEKDAITQAYGGQQCLAQCKLEKNIAKVDEDCPKPKAQYEKPFCSREPPYEVCKTKCWRAKSGKNELSELYGVEFLHEYKTNETALISEALAEQQQIGLWGASPKPTDKMLDKVFQLGEAPGSFGDTMPLCVSEYIDFNKNDQFPCQCGPWDSNGTKIFMEKVGLTPNDADWMSKPNQNTMINVCPQFIKNRLPAARFKLFCDLNIGFPRTDRGPWFGDERWNFRMEKDPLCDEILPKFKGKSDIEASKWFCERSEALREELQNKERSSAWGGVWNHWDLCQWFIKRNYEKRWDS